MINSISSSYTVTRTRKNIRNSYRFWLLIYYAEPQCLISFQLWPVKTPIIWRNWWLSRLRKYLAVYFTEVCDSCSIDRLYYVCKGFWLKSLLSHSHLYLSVHSSYIGSVITSMFKKCSALKSVQLWSVQIPTIICDAPWLSKYN